MTRSRGLASFLRPDRYEKLGYLYIMPRGQVPIIFARHKSSPSSCRCQRGPERVHHSALVDLWSHISWPRRGGNCLLGSTRECFTTDCLPLTSSSFRLRNFWLHSFHSKHNYLSVFRLTKHEMFLCILSYFAMCIKLKL